MTTPGYPNPDPLPPPPPPAPGQYTGGYIAPDINPANSWIQKDAAPKRKHRGLLILALAGGFVLLLAVLGIGMAIGGMSGTPTAKPTAASAWDREQAAKAAASNNAPTTEPAAESTGGPTPAIGDIALHPKITSKECFGSAGCFITLKVQAEYSGPLLNPDDTWLVTYEINGVEDGPQIGSFELTGTTYDMNEENVSTKSSRSKITIKTTSVEKVGL